MEMTVNESHLVTSTVAVRSFVVIVLLISVAGFYYIYNMDIYHFSMVFNKSNTVCKAPDVSKLIGAYGDMGKFGRKVVTDLTGAQALFNQGFIHLVGYNTIESLRNFESCISLDPSCLMCYLGAMVSYGPNINTIMSDDDYIRGKQFKDAALNLIDKSTSINEVEKDIFLAHAQKFPESLLEWRVNGQAYYEGLFSEAMLELVKKYPTDVDIHAWYGESLVNLTPWHYYNSNGEFEPNIKTALQYFNQAMALHPNHLLVLHLLIHIYEQSRTPADGEVFADRLASLSKSEGTTHLIHMPAHLFFRLGRYDDCVTAGKLAVAKDIEYKSLCFEPYVPLHNRAMLIFGALYSGDMQLALQHSVTAAQLPSYASVYVTSLFPTPIVSMTDHSFVHNIIHIT